MNLVGPRFLIDTNVCIRVLNGTAPVTVEWMETLAVGDAAVSAISFGEFVRGYILKRAEQPDRPPLDRVMGLFDHVPVVPFDRAAAVRLCKAPLDAGRRIDVFIAAHALALGAVMVTADARFPRLDGLMVHLLDAIEAHDWPA